jgi:hypothetical protein
MKKYGGSILNGRLLDRQNVSDTEKIIIHKLHETKHYVFELMENTDDSTRLKRYAQIVESIEYRLQKHWGFNIDKSMHNWYDVPKCSCPKSDNAGMKGTIYRTISKNCKVHG